MRIIPIALIGMLCLSPSLFAASTIQFTTRSFAVSESAGEAKLPVIRLDDIESVVSVEYYSQATTAVDGEDYTEVSGLLTFSAGETNQTISIPILNNGFFKPSRRFQVFLTNPTGDAILGSYQIVTCTIQENETLPELEYSSYQVHEDEESVLIGIMRGGEWEEAITLDYATIDGTAHAGEDYDPISGTLTFAAGENLKLLTIPILNDGLQETSEAFRIYLTNATPAGMIGVVQVASILIPENDSGAQFTRNALWVREQEGVVSLTVTRGNDGLLGPFTVDFATTSDTAMAGSDYTETQGTLVFAAGEMTQSFNVPILSGEVAKPDRQFQVALSNPTGGMTLGPSRDVLAVITVFDEREMLPHQFDAVQVGPDGTVNLVLGGGYTPGLGVVNRFEDYFDIYPVDVSSNLVDWLPLAWVVRTNKDTRLPAVTDAQANESASRFYRIATNNFSAPLPPPTGPYAVGRTERFVTDPTRRNRNRISTNSSFGITVWYPAERQAGEIPRPYFEESIASDLQKWPAFRDRAPSFHSHSVQNARFARDAGVCPVVLFSHGLGLNRQDSVDKTENLASHGYVTVSVDHYDCNVTVLSDGRYISTAGWSVTDEGLQDRVRDLSFVLSQLEIWNQQDPLLVDRLDLGKLAAAGFSYGGAVAAEFSRVEPRCLAAVNLDGFAPAGTLTRPTLTMNGDGNYDMGVFEHTASTAYWLQITSTVHGNFSGGYWLLGGETASAREASRTINAFALWFLNKYARGSGDPMPALPDYPRAINFRQK